MKIEKRKISEGACSCSFCDRGKLANFDNCLEYPYDIIYEFTKEGGFGCGISARICSDCFKELKKEINILNN